MFALIDSLFHKRDESEAPVLLRLVFQRNVHILKFAKGKERGVEHSLRHGLVQTTCRGSENGKMAGEPSQMKRIGKHGHCRHGDGKTLAPLGRGSRYETTSTYSPTYRVVLGLAMVYFACSRSPAALVRVC